MIVLDQFGRSIYRGTPVGYANDEKASELVKYICEKKWDTEVYNEAERRSTRENETATRYLIL